MRIVLKLGTSTLTHPTGNLNIRRVEELCKVLSDLKNAGHELILVSSGAIGMGMGKLSLLQRPEDIPTKQAAAAVGAIDRRRTILELHTSVKRAGAGIIATYWATELARWLQEES